MTDANTLAAVVWLDRHHNDVHVLTTVLKQEYMMAVDPSVFDTNVYITQDCKPTFKRYSQVYMYLMDRYVYGVHFVVS